MNKLKTVMLLLLMVAVMPLSSQTVSERLQRLGGLLGNAQDQQFLHPDQAFVPSINVQGPALLHMDMTIADGYYLYHDKFSFEITEGDAAVAADRIVIPPGKVKEDPSFGSVEVNYNEVQVDIPLLRGGAGETPVSLEFQYQGCKDDSLCYPPITRNVQLLLPAGTDPSVGADAANIAAQAEVPRVSEQDGFTRRLMTGGVLLNTLMFFGAGLLLSMTPCVFPMIPILSGIIVGQEKAMTPMRGFILSLVYVLAMAMTYAVIGVLAALAGFNIQAAAQNIWVITLFCLVFVALALSMFGFYEIRIPAGLQNRLVHMTNSRQGGTLSGVAIMGAVSAIIVGPCVAPPLVGALAYISQTGDELLGGMALFAMGLGMGVPLLIIGGSAGTLLPRAGAWMETVKKIFGVGLLALAIWFLARVVSPAVELYLWGALLIVSAIYMGALDQLDRSASWTRLWKGLGLIMLVYGIMLVIGGATGSSNVYRPLQGVMSNRGAATGPEAHLAFKRIKSVDDLERELLQAGAAGRPLMLDFYADWCIECIRMESNTFPHPGVRSALTDVVLLQADVTANDKTDKALLEHFGIYGPPAILFFDTNGHERKAWRLYGYMGPDEFITHVQQATGSTP